MSREIVIRGAREHNLKNLSLTLPRNKFIVFTGLSGSGKSSLAFDTIYAEGQRRYLESLSAYARQFMEQMTKPAVDSIDGLSPSISIEQKNISRNPRSTVGTVTEIYDYLRLLYARVGVPHCSSCGKPIRTQTLQNICSQILEQDIGTKFAVLAPIARGKKGEFQKELLELRAQGFARAWIDGEEISLSFPVKLKKNIKHDISIFVDRLILKPGIEARLSEAVEMASSLANGLIEVHFFYETKKEARFFSTKFACPECGTSFPEIEPRSFSFNSQHGACPKCDGMGVQQRIDPQLVIPDPCLSLNEGAVRPWAEGPKSRSDRILTALAESFKIDLDTPFKDLSQANKDLLLYGSKGRQLEYRVASKGVVQTFKQEFDGIIPPLEERLDIPDERDEELESYSESIPCEVCVGTRLKKESLFVYVGTKNIAEICAIDIEACQKYLHSIEFSKTHLMVAEPIMKEIHARLDFLRNVGLSYLSLSRTANTLSGGEAQRIRLATQIGSSLVGVLYVLDEPSIGLHQRDNEKLIQTLEHLRDQGNTVLVVEHDEETIRRADFVVDLGPGAGDLGGKLMYFGKPSDIVGNSESLTAKYLSGELEIAIPTRRRLADPKRLLTIQNAKTHNLRDITVDLPLGLFICVSGVSGSGKSSLILDTLLRSVEDHFLGQQSRIPMEKLIGLDQLDKVIHVDQSPIGRTPRSNPATYTGVFGDIRALFAQLPESRARGYKPGRFSFNVEGGRCEACSGDGAIKITMHFLPDVFTPCEVCRSRRYNRETLEVQYRGKSIADVLGMTIEQGHAFFERVPQIRTKLQTLLDVGLGYITLGQSATTLSGGEAQRIKLARELTRRATGRTLYILDEPTTGLHFEDVRKLLQILQLLVDQGNTVVVIEHNLDVIKQADHVIDLGPEGGSGGGEIVFAGTPEDLAKREDSFTGKFLKIALARRPNTAAEPSKKVKSSQPEY